MNERVTAFLRAAFDAARTGMADGKGGPFGAVVAKGDTLIAVGANRVVKDCDPTAHAEVTALREACRRLETHVLEGCEIYCTTEPCPMCLSAIYWARVDRVWFAATREDAARIGFDDAVIYREVSLDIRDRRLPMTRVVMDEAEALFDAWEKLPNKVPY